MIRLSVGMWKPDLSLVKIEAGCSYSCLRLIILKRRERFISNVRLKMVLARESIFFSAVVHFLCIDSHEYLYIYIYTQAVENDFLETMEFESPKWVESIPLVEKHFNDNSVSSVKFCQTRASSRKPPCIIFPEVKVQSPPIKLEERLVN